MNFHWQMSSLFHTLKWYTRCFCPNGGHVILEGKALALWQTGSGILQCCSVQLMHCGRCQLSLFFFSHSDMLILVPSDNSIFLYALAPSPPYILGVYKFLYLIMSLFFAYQTMLSYTAAGARRSAGAPAPALSNNCPLDCKLSGRVSRRVCWKPICRKGALLVSQINN